jgi:hypothetical protein
MIPTSTNASTTTTDNEKSDESTVTITVLDYNINDAIARDEWFKRRDE